MRRASALALLAAIFLPQTVHGLDLQPKFDAPARRLIEDRAAVGLAIGIYKDGQTQVVGYGETKKGSGVVPDGDTVYEIGSITKVFTAILLADMMQKGVVRLDAPVQDYLPSSVRVRAYAYQPIKLLDLVTHTSGLPRDPENLYPVDALNPFADYTVKQLYDFLDSYRPRRPPGEYEYSNLGMGLVGHVLTLRSGKTYEQLLIERICVPLDMRDTRTRPSPDMLKRLATPYNPLLWPVESWDLPVLAGAGGIRSTVNDMLKLVRANLVDERTPLSAAIRMTHERRYIREDGMGVGLAWHISTDGTILRHDGSTGGYRSYLTIVPSRNLGLVVLANTRNDRVVELATTIRRLMLEDAPGTNRRVNVEKETP